LLHRIKYFETRAQFDERLSVIHVLITFLFDFVLKSWPWVTTITV